jgi:sulfur-oxidizing protein SoxY
VIDPVTSEGIAIKAPEIAENGAQVPVEITSQLPGTRSIYIFVDKNPQPLAGTFEFREGAEPFVSTRIKMSESSILRVVVQSDGKFYMATREIKVTIGGCGE